MLTWFAQKCALRTCDKHKLSIRLPAPTPPHSLQRAKLFFQPRTRGVSFYLVCQLTIPEHRALLRHVPDPFWIEGERFVAQTIPQDAKSKTLVFLFLIYAHHVRFIRTPDCLRWIGALRMLVCSRAVLFKTSARTDTHCKRA